MFRLNPFDALVANCLGNYIYRLKFHFICHKISVYQPLTSEPMFVALKSQPAADNIVLQDMSICLVHLKLSGLFLLIILSVWWTLTFLTGDPFQLSLLTSTSGSHMFFERFLFLPLFQFVHHIIDFPHYLHVHFLHIQVSGTDNCNVNLTLNYNNFSFF